VEKGKKEGSESELTSTTFANLLLPPPPHPVHETTSSVFLTPIYLPPFVKFSRTFL